MHIKIYRKVFPLSFDIYRWIHLKLVFNILVEGLILLNKVLKFLKTLFSSNFKFKPIGLKMEVFNIILSNKNSRKDKV